MIISNDSFKRGNTSYHQGKSAVGRTVSKLGHGATERESSLVIMDIVVELEDHSIANVEVQKIGYKFSGQRSACYSADLLLRQYKRVRGERGRAFSYRDIQKVYTIVFFEKSPKELREDKMNCIHRFTQVSDTGVKMELLQEFCFVSLDIFRELLHNNGIRNKLDAWLTFLSVDEPETIVKLITEYPQFKKYYEEIYQLCLNTEKVMNMFSKELQELDRNTVQYMIDEMQDAIDSQKETIKNMQKNHEQALADLAEKDRELAELRAKLAVSKESF